MVARTALVEIGIRVKHDRPLDDADRRDWELLRAGYDTMRHMTSEHSHLVPDRWVAQSSLSGTAEQVREQVQQLVADGWDEVVIVPFGPDVEAVVRDFGEQVIQRL
jgi:alkanesulfonate monooxygenase SsuD/methylene tetrahydromethanopterin reductase-like flavin-dependent oxidoreductase (luciferase family)